MSVKSEGKSNDTLDSSSLTSVSITGDSLPSSISDDLDDEKSGSESLDLEADNIDYPLQQGLIVIKALQDFSGSEEGDLSFTAGELLTLRSVREDGWWEAANHQGEIGIVPSTFFKIYKTTGVAQKEREASYIKLNGRLLPPSSLGCLLAKDDQYSTASFLSPKLSSSGLTFQDLNWDHKTERLLGTPVSIQRTLTILQCKQNLTIGTDLKIASCHIRFCLHDENQILSNIHTVHSKFDPSNPKLWHFSSKKSSSLEQAKCFIRTSHNTPSIGILFQACITLILPEKDQEATKEISCGWAFLRLLTDSGQPIADKSKVLLLQPGEPFQHSKLQPKARNSLFTLGSKKRQPHLAIRIGTPIRRMAKQLGFQPETLVGRNQDLPLLVMYRHILAEKLIQNQKTHSAELIPCPVLATFTRLFSQPDILDVLKGAWNKQVAAEKLTPKHKSFSKAKEQFTKIYIGTVLPLFLADLPPFEKSFGTSSDKQNKRQSILTKALESMGKDPQESLSLLLSSSLTFRPLSMGDLTLNVLTPNLHLS